MEITLKTIDTITEEDLQGLITNKVIENQKVEYKRDLPGNSDSEKKEFLADVSSFANASGGLLIYGIESENGIPQNLQGISDNNIDNVKNRLESFIRDGIEPRIPNISIKELGLTSGNAVVLISMPSSLQSPHMVVYGGHSKFYTRNSAGKYPMDVIELRRAFQLTDSFNERIRGFRFQRLSKIVGDELEIKLMEHPPVVLHSVSLSSFESVIRIDLPSLEKKVHKLVPVIYPEGINNWGHLYNLDGYMSRSILDDGRVYAYMQIFRNGVIEVVDALSMHNKNKLIPHAEIEELILNNLKRMTNLQEELGITGPYALFVSLPNIGGYKIRFGGMQSFYINQTERVIHEKSLLFPEVVIQKSDEDYEAVLKPIFDILWNASGYPRSLNYDDQGKRIPSQ